MSDLRHWQHLSGPAPGDDVEDLVEHLRGLARLEAGVRWPYAALVEPWLVHPDPQVRATAAACLSGFTGLLAWEGLVRALHDGSEVVRLAALEALRDSAIDEPSQWVHALFHEHPEVRRRAVEQPAERLKTGWWIPLLGAEHTRSVVCERLDRQGLPTDQLPLLVRHTAAGHLDDAWLLERLPGLQWRREASLILAAFAPALHEVPDLDASPDQLAARAEANAVQPDGLDPLLELLGRGHAAGHPGAAGVAETLLDRARRNALDEVQERRLATAVLCHFRGRGTALPLESLALAALVFPGTLGLATRLTLAERRDTARHLMGARLRDPPGDVVQGLPWRSLLLTAEGPDLRVGAAMVSLGGPEMLQEVASAAGQAAVVAAMLADPEAGAWLVGQVFKGSEGWTTRGDLLAAAVGAPPSQVARLHAELCIVHPSATAVLLEESDGALQTAVLLALDQVAEAGRLGQRGATVSAKKALEVCGARPLVGRVLFRERLAGPVSRAVLTLALKELEPADLVRLPVAALRRLVALDRASEVMPWPVAVELATALEDHPDPVLATWADELTPSRSAPTLPPVHGSHELGPEAAARISTAREDELALVLTPCLAGPTQGVCAALAIRPDPVLPLAQAVVALLVSHDPVDQVATEAVRYGVEHGPTRAEAERLLTGNWPYREDLGPLAGAWLFRWEKPHAAFLAWMESTPDGVRRALEGALHLPSPTLRLATWQAVRHALGKWRWWQPEKVRSLADEATVELLLLVLTGRRVPGSTPRSWPTDEEDRVGLQGVAAKIFARLVGAGCSLPEARSTVLGSLGELTEAARTTLGSWLRSTGPVPTVRPAPAPAPVELDVEEALASRSAAALAPLVHHPAEGVAVEACLQLAELGDEGAAALLAGLLLPHAHHRGLLSETVSMWPDGASIAAARAALSDPSHPPPVRFHVALGLLERGEEVLDAALAAAREPVTRPWLRRRDLDRLLVTTSDHDRVAASLARASGHTPVDWAVVHLTGSSDDEALAHEVLRDLLLLDGVSPAPRLRAALWLRAHADPLGEPLILADRLHRARDRQPREEWEDWAAHLSGAAVVRAARSAMIAGHRWVPGFAILHGLTHRDADPRATEPAALEVLTHTRLQTLQERALRHLDSSALRSAAARRLAEVFLWGQDQGRRLLGRRYRVQMIGGDTLGWTRLEQRTVYVNPLPLLRGDRGGEAIVRGLIVHELGHHVFNADAQGRAIWTRAQSERLSRLHNLVCDEHLERNLRAMDPEWNASLKTLGAWAFRHARRELVTGELLTLLGVHAAGVLVPTRLEPARRRNTVQVGLGRLFQALEAAGSPLVRFVRALRMGLGNRSGDPLVARALALFDRRFRDLDNEGLYEVTLALAELFEGELALMDLVDLHGTASDGAEGGETLVEGRGVTDPEIDREVERLERTRAQPTGRPQRATPARAGKGRVDQVVVGPETDFSRIDRVVVLPCDPVAQAALAAEVVRPARHLRDALALLGLRHRTVHARLRGTRVDRGRLLAGAIRGDPRILAARERVLAADLFLGVVVDCSGSMAGERMERARRFAALLAEASRDLEGVDLRIFGFTESVIYDAGTAEQCAAHALEAGGGNNDAAGLWHTAQHALASRRSARLLVMISDGLPTECTTTALRTLVHRLQRRHHLPCAQVAVATLHERCFDTYLEVITDDIDEAVRRFGRIVTGLVASTLRG